MTMVNENVTTEMIRTAIKNTGKEFFPVRECSICNTSIGYVLYGDFFGYDSSCGCTTWASDPQKRDWDDAADLINMQTNPTAKVRIAAVFGFEFKDGAQYAEK